MENKNAVIAALGAYKSALLGVGAFSGVVNILMLTGPLFMLQIYDRVLPSRSLPTLLALLALTIALFAFMGILDFLRSQILGRIGDHMDEALGEKVLSVVLDIPLRMGDRTKAGQLVRDLDQVRQFIGGPAPIAVFDFPWTPLYLLVVFLFHPTLGLVATAGAVVLLCLTALNEFGTRKPMKAALASASLRHTRVEAGRRNAEILQALGMRGNFLRRYGEINQRYLSYNRRASDIAQGFGSTTKAFRFLLQSLILAIGAVLAVKQIVSPGVMIAASIISSRALSPIEQAIAQWRSFIATRQSYRRLVDALSTTERAPERTKLPPPEKALTIHELAVAPPGTKRAVVAGVSFALKAGDGLGIIGPSAAGKSTLARALVGVWGPTRGTIRLDGATLDQWSAEALGPHFGYLPQDVELFEGTVAENISRFAEKPESEAIIAAARSAGAHEMIVGLPKGYDTQIGEGGSVLSAGQRQRIALARALFGEPFLIVLDEPNSNVDAEGEQALLRAIKACRARGAIVIIIAHRPSAIAAVDLLLVLERGQVRGFGPKEEVLRKTVVAAPSERGGPRLVAELAQ